MVFLARIWCFTIWLGAASTVASTAAATDLSGLVQEALAKNPELLQMQAEQRSLVEQADATAYWPDPSLSANYFMKPIVTRLGEQRASFVLTQPMPFPGKLGAKQSQVRHQAQALAHEIEAKRLAITVQVKSLFYKGYALQKRLAYLRVEREMLQDISQVALARVAVGKTGQQDVTQANLEIGGLAQKEQTLRQELASLQTGLNRLLDRAAGAKIVFPSTLKMPMAKITPQGFQALLASAKARHPATLAAKAKMAAADANVKYEKLAAVPDLKLSASYFRIDEDRPDNDGSNEDAYSIGAGITIPLWWGRYSNRSDQALAKKQAATYAVVGAQRDVESELVDLWSQAVTAKELLQIYESTLLPQAEQVLSANQSAYQQGGVSFDRVITDFQRLLNLKAAQYAEEARLLTLIGKIEAALGGAWPQN